MADTDLVFVAGASENHARPLFHLLRSIDHHEPGARIVLYDLGLAPDSLAALRRQGRTVVAFPFDDYPAHVDRNDLLNYAWKPAMVHAVMRAHGLPLLYLDAGDLLHGPLTRVRAELARVGFYCPRLRGVIGRLFHPASLQAFEAARDLLGAGNRNAAIVGFGDCPLAREIITGWFEAAMNPAIICPPGATKQNHRYDQAILSVLLARAIRDRGLVVADELLGISFHNDPLTERQARIYMKHDPHKRGAGPVLRARAERRRQPMNRLKRAARRALRTITAVMTRG